MGGGLLGHRVPPALGCPPPHFFLFPRGANDTIFFTTYLNNSCSKYFSILSHISGGPVTLGTLQRQWW